MVKNPGGRPAGYLQAQSRTRGCRETTPASGQSGT